MAVLSRVSGWRDQARTRASDEKMPLHWSRTLCESGLKPVSPRNRARHFLLAAGHGSLIGRLGSSHISLPSLPRTDSCRATC